MASFTLHFSDGNDMKFPDEDDATIGQVIDWFKASNQDSVLTVNALNGTVHIQKRHLTYIEVPS